MLIQITKMKNKGVQGLLDQVFGFLKRRTDFFIEAEPGANMGFPPDAAKNMTAQFFQKYQQIHFAQNPQVEGLKERWEDYYKKHHEMEEQKIKLEKEAKEKKESQPEEEAKVVEVTSESPASKTPDNPVKEVKKTEINQKMVDISTYNGDTTDDYKWSQSHNEVEVQVDLPPGTKAKQLNIVMRPKNLKIQIKGEDKPLVDGELDNKIKPDDSFWTIEDGQRLILTFVKATETIWKTVILGDKEIDTKKVDNSKNLSDFDEETQGHLRKVLYEQNRKNRGLPTTEEEKQAELMKKVWNADNSPFKGQPYDPSMMTGGQPQIPFQNS